MEIGTNCLTIVKPHAAGNKTVGIPVEQDNPEPKTQDEDTGRIPNANASRKEELSQKFEKISKTLKNKLRAFEEEDQDEETIRQNKVQEIREYIEERESTLTPVDKSSISGSTPKNESSKDGKKKGWHIKISKKQSRLLKKLGFSIIILGFAMSLSQIIPDLFEEKFSYASDSKRSGVSCESDNAEIGHDYLEENGVLDLEKLQSLLKERTADSNAKESVKNEKPKIKTDGKFKKRMAKMSVSSKFGYRNDPFTSKRKYHSGIDIARPYRAPIKAIQNGLVEFSGYREGYGNLIVIRHGDRSKAYYGHNAKNIVLKGESVKKGQVIGYVGMTGRTTGPHLHFEIRKNNVPTDPIKYLEGIFAKEGRISL